MAPCSRECTALLVRHRLVVEPARLPDRVVEPADGRRLRVAHRAFGVAGLDREGLHALDRRRGGRWWPAPRRCGRRSAGRWPPARRRRRRRSRGTTTQDEAGHRGNHRRDTAGMVGGADRRERRPAPGGWGARGPAALSNVQRSGGVDLAEYVEEAAAPMAPACSPRVAGSDGDGRAVRAPASSRRTRPAPGRAGGRPPRPARRRARTPAGSKTLARLTRPGPPTSPARPARPAPRRRPRRRPR